MKGHAASKPREVSKMNDDLVSPERDDSRAKQVTLDLYEDLLQTIWSKTCRTLGPPTVQILLHQAIAKTLTQYGWLEFLQVDRQAGLVLNDVREQLEQIDGISLKEGLQALISSLLSTMTSLTGSIVTNLLIGMIDERLSAEGITDVKGETLLSARKEDGETDGEE
jgi:hypothetical protein